MYLLESIAQIVAIDDRIGQNTSATNDWAPRNLAGNLLDKFALRPIEVSGRVHDSHRVTRLYPNLSSRYADGAVRIIVHMKVSRRELARTMGAAVVMPAIAAIPIDVQAQPSTSNEETQSARDLLRSNSEAIAKVKLPMATEPPFHFKA